MKKILSLILVIALCASFVMTFSVSAEEGFVTDGLKAFYDGSIHSEDGKTWTDASGNGLDIDLSGVDSAAGYFEGDAFVSNSVKVNFPAEIASLISTGSFTTELVVGDTEVLGSSFGTYLNTSNDNYSLFMRTGATPYIEFKCAGNARPKVAVEDINYFKDSTITVTYDKAGDVCLYANGELLMSVPCTVGAFNCTDFFFGYAAGNAREHNTEFKAMRFYDRPLTADEVASNYAADCAGIDPAVEDGPDTPDPVSPETGDYSVTVTGDEGVVIPDAAALAKLTDGVIASDASAFSDARLMNINWDAAFDYSNVESNSPKTAELILDLGKVTAISGVKLNAYKELNSFVDLPAVKVYLSNDGDNFVRAADGTWTSAVDGLVAGTDRSAAPNGAAVYFADWSTRATLDARYVKFELSLSDPFTFLSEVEVTDTIADGKVPLEENLGVAIDQIVYNGVNVPIQSGTATILTSEAGEISLNDGAEGDYALARAGVITVAKWDEELAGYVVISNAVNPWPNDREGSMTLGDDEIGIFTISNGTIENAGAGNKWVIWHIEVGDVLHVYDGVITIGVEPDGGRQIHFGADEPVDPDTSKEESKETSKETSKEESKAPVTPKTGDSGMIALAIVSVITLAGVVIVKKSK